MSKTLISIIGGLSGMFGWGISDFFANEASSKVGHEKTLFWSQTAGIILIGLAVVFFSGRFEFTTRLFLLTLISGIAYTLGYLLFYKGFEIGNISVISATVNFQQVFIILISYFVFKQRLTTFQFPALILLLVGITLVSINFNELKKGSILLSKGVKETFIATILFGALFWPLNEYISERADWIIVSFITKAIALMTMLLIARIQRKSLYVKNPTTRLKYVIVAVGILEALAILGVSFGVAFGDAIIVGPIAGALTAVTVSMSMIFLKEQITRSQSIGILLTIIGVILTGF